MELENNEEGKGKGNKKRIAIIAAIIAVVVAAFLLLSPHEPEASSIKDAANTTQEQLDEEAMKSRLWVSVANTIYADSATDTCYATDKDGNKITTLGDLSGWDVSNLTNASYMFRDCRSLTTIGNLPGWDTSSLTDASSMFDNCYKLTTLGDLSGWNTSSLTNVSSMFSYCSRLSVNCSNWDVSKVTNHSNFNTNAPGVILPLAWQTSNDEGVEDSAIAPLCEEQENGDALSVSSGNDNNKTASKTDGEASADSEAGSSNTASADDAGAKEEEASGDIVQEETAAA